MPVRLLALAVLFLLAANAGAQRPVFEPDDFIDPNMLTAPLFLSQVALGGVWNPSDRFRPIDEDSGLLLLTGSLHVDRFQFAYKHAEFVGMEEPVPLRRCDCPDPVYFPTPPPPGATPDGPSAERSETLQFAFYRTARKRPITLRYRASWTSRTIDATVLSPNGEVLERRSGRDQSFVLDADTHVAMGRHDLWGSLYVARASRSGMPDDRAHNEFAYVARLPGWAAGPFLFRTNLTVGHITDRDVAGLNLVNPRFEAFWRHKRTKATLHFVWSGEWTRTRLEGWQPNHQIAVFLDRTLYVKMFDAR